MAVNKTWTEKFLRTKQAQIKRIDMNFADIPANSNMFIATPAIIDDYINKIPKGKKVAVQTMRKDLAIEHNADHTCPVTTGIFLRIVAEAGFEKYQQTNSLAGITPFWRMIAPNSILAKKLTCGQDFIINQRKFEGIAD